MSKTLDYDELSLLLKIDTSSKDIDELYRPEEVDANYSLKNNITFSRLPIFKILIVGDGAVGKTTLRRSFMGEKFKDNYIMTIGADFSLYKYSSPLIHNNTINFQLWDLAGQQRFREVLKNFFLGAIGALIVVDITRPETFEDIAYWANTIWKHSEYKAIPFIIIVNKIDLEPELDANLKNYLIGLCNKLSIETKHKYGFPIKAVFTSAKTGEGVAESFTMLFQNILFWQGYIETLV